MSQYLVHNSSCSEREAALSPRQARARAARDCTCECGWGGSITLEGILLVLCTVYYHVLCIASRTKQPCVQGPSILNEQTMCQHYRGFPPTADSSPGPGRKKSIQIYAGLACTRQLLLAHWTCRVSPRDGQACNGPGQISPRRDAFWRASQQPRCRSAEKVGPEACLFCRGASLLLIALARGK